MLSRKQQFRRKTVYFCLCFEQRHNEKLVQIRIFHKKVFTFSFRWSKMAM